MADQRFTAKSRLHASSEFDAVFKNTQYRLGTAEFLILAKKNGSQHSRIGMVIGKKTTKLAVNRNKIKRAIRESFRLDFPQNLNVDVVIISRAGANNCSKTKFTNNLLKAWGKLASKILAQASDD